MATEKIDLNNLDKSDWKIYRFDEIAQNISERVDPNNTDLEVYIGLEHIDSESLHIKRHGTPNDVNGTKLKFYKDDIIFGRRRAYQRKAGIATCDGFCSAHALVLRANPDIIDPALFPFFMHSDLFMNRAVDISVGSLSPTINWGTLKHQEFLIPPLKLHLKIVGLFLLVEDTLRKNIKLLESAKICKESVIEENLTTKSNGSVIFDYCETDGVRIGPFGSLLHKSDYTAEGVPVIMPADIINGVIQEETVSRISTEKASELENYRLKENDILFPRRGDLTKRAIVKKHQEGWICGTGTLRVRLMKGVDPMIVYFAVTSISTNQWLLASAVGTTMPNLNASTIKKIPLHLPKGPNAAETLKKVELAIRTEKTIEKHVDAVRNLKFALIEQVF